MRISTTLVTVLLALACGTAHAQMYRWVDKDGKTRYGDIAPSGVKAIELKGAGSALPAAPSTSPTPLKDAKATAQARKTLEDHDPQDNTAKLEKDRVDAAMRQKNCERAQNNMTNLKSAEGAQRQAEGVRQTPLDETRAEIAKYCK